MSRFLLDAILCAAFVSTTLIPAGARGQADDLLQMRWCRADVPAVKSIDDVRERRLILVSESQQALMVKGRYPENAPTHDQLELVEVVAESWFRNYKQN